MRLLLPLTQVLRRRVELVVTKLSKLSYKVFKKMFSGMYLETLLEILQSVEDSNGNLNVVYPIIQKNIKFLDYLLIDVMNDWAISNLEEANDDEQKLIAIYIGKLGLLIRDFKLENAAFNTELTISCFNIVLRVFTVDKDPQNWGTFQSMLAAAYIVRLNGNKGENLELAIEYLQNSLQVINKTNTPREWANIQQVLGFVYADRILGSKSDNLEESIRCYLLAVEIYTKEEFPIEWAKIQNALAHIYRDRIKGEKVENIKKAIQCCELAKNVYTEISFPKEWVSIQCYLADTYTAIVLDNHAENIEKAINLCVEAMRVIDEIDDSIDWADNLMVLANAYSQRIFGNRADNLDKAIDLYNLAIKTFTEKDFPKNWARIQNNLAAVYWNRINGYLADNIETSIKSAKSALKILARIDFSQDWAVLQNTLGNAYKDRINGNRAENIEKAILYYEAPLTVRTKTNLPIEWAETQANLGAAYSIRIKGNKSENIEKAILAYESALTIFTKTSFPEKWATLQNNIGNAYGDRIQGDRGENIDREILCHEAALSVRTEMYLPMEQSNSESNLATAYLNRIRGKKAENLEKAIDLYNIALQYYTKSDFPRQWAKTQTNLANAFSVRIIGDRSENLEKAIEYYISILEIGTKKDLPELWAMTQHNLAYAYSNRIRENKSENLETSIKHYEASIEVHTKKDFPIEWAMTQYNLASIYYERVRGDREGNLEKAIECCMSALEVRTKKDFPIEWAMTQDNLGSIYIVRIRGAKAVNLEKAIECFACVVEIITKQNLPIDWANNQNNLGNVYYHRIKGDRAENLDKAIQCYTSALDIFTPQDLPIDCLMIAKNLGNVHFTSGSWQKAIDAYLLAITAVEQSRSWATTDQNKQETLERAIEVYYSLVQSCINAQQYDKALEYAERSKSRNLVDLLANRDTYPRGEIAPEILTGLTELRKQVLIAERQIQQQNNRSGQGFMDGDDRQRGIAISQSSNAIEHIDRLVSLKQELDRLITTHIQPVDPSFQLTQKVEPICFEEMRSALPNDRTALITWYVAQDKLVTFIVTPQSTHPQLIESTPEAFQQFIEVLTEYQTAYSQYRDRQNKDWKTALPQYLAQFSQTLGLAEILQQLPPECDRAILIPHRYLHLIPLHALPIELPDGTETCLLDRLPQGVRYAPSVQLLKLAQQWSRPPLKNLLAVQDPTQDLTFTNLEVTALRTHFQPFDRVFRHQAAQKFALTPELLAQSNCVHFSCHGVFDFANPTQSALMLSESLVTAPNGQKILDLEKCLTLGEIFAQDLRQCRLVTLSACETGIVDVSKQIDEYIGLPSGFLFAGSPSIVSSLWAVDDLSTTCLMIRFYNNLQQTDSVSIALNDAQRWLRQANGQEIKEMVTPWLAQSGIRPSRVMEIDAQLDRIEQESEPFAAPYHWAAFCAIGQ